VIDNFTDIDGQTPLDLDELKGLKHPHVTTRGQLDQLEQVNIQQGLIWLSRRRNAALLSDEFVRKLHRQLLGDVWSWAGTYRLTAKNIGIDPYQIPVQLGNLLADVNYWIDHKIYPPMEIALRFHHRLVAIHPFVNGNGRFARILTDELLARVLTTAPIDWSGGYALQAMNERREQYVAALRAADRGDYALLFEFADYRHG
jgi:Fic-DOC domain mobile mystery protein B